MPARLRLRDSLALHRRLRPHARRPACVPLLLLRGALRQVPHVRHRVVRLPHPVPSVLVIGIAQVPAALRIGVGFGDGRRADDEALEVGELRDFPFVRPVAEREDRVAGIDTGGVREAMAAAHLVVEETFRFGRHTGVCLEARAITADYNPSEQQLTVYLGNQAPHMMRDIFARHLDLPEANVRVIARDVGGSFGIKVHVYPDEMAIVGVAKLLGRPIRYSADRLESMSTDIEPGDCGDAVGQDGADKECPHHEEVGPDGLLDCFG